MSRASEFAAEYKMRVTDAIAANTYMNELMERRITFKVIPGHGENPLILALVDEMGNLDMFNKSCMIQIPMKPKDALAFAAWIVEQFKD